MSDSIDSNDSSNSTELVDPKKTSKNVRIFWTVTFSASVIFGLIMLANENSRAKNMIAETGGVVSSLPKIGASTDFSFTDQTGKIVTQKIIENKVWIMNLMFTSCEGPCPLMSHHMNRMQRSFQGDDDVRFVSITTDPDTDTVEVLKDYAKKYSAVPNKWYFLTGEKKTIIDFAVKSLKLPAGDNPMLHSTRLVLIDKQGQIRGYYDSQARAQMERLKSHVKLLLEAPAT